MKALLVNPINRIINGVIPDLGLAYLTTALKKDNHFVYVLDCNNEWNGFKKLKQAIKIIKPDIIGFKIFSTDLFSARKSVFLAKELNPRAVIIIGGPHPTCASPQDVMDCFGVADFAFKGEAEIGLPLLLQRLSNLNTKHIEDIPGLIWRNNGSIMVNPQIFIDDLDRFDMPSWDTIDLRKYNGQSVNFTKHKVVAPVIATRGCPYKCAYCAVKLMQGNHLRMRSISSVIEEIKYLVSQYNIREIRFLDENLTANRDFLLQLCESLIEQRFKINWYCFGMRLDGLDKEALLLMERSGCYMISPGIESGSQRILDAMNRNMNIEQIREKLFLIKRFTKIRVFGTFIIGYPGETKEDILKTIDFSVKLPLYTATFYAFQFIPGTTIYNKLITDGQIEKRIRCGRHDIGKMLFIPKGLSHRELLRLYRWAYLRFYVRPKVALRILKAANTFALIKFLFKRLIGEFKNK